MADKPTLDFVTLMVPRDNAGALLKSFKKHCLDYNHYNWNWIAHIDSIPLLEQDFPYSKAHDLAKELGAKYFDSYTIMITDANCGHSESFIRCMRQVRHDYFYMEDDKLFIRDFHASDYVNDGAHQFNLQDPRGRVGHTSSGFCRKELAKKMVELWPAEGAAKVQDVEHYYKRIFAFKPEFRKGHSPIAIAEDGGMQCTNQHGLVRRYVRGQLTYEKAPDAIITTYIASKEAATQWQASRFLRNWMLSMESYRTIVYANYEYPELAGFEVRRAIRWGNYERQACKLGGTVLYINPYLRPWKSAKFTFNMQAELAKDVHEWPNGEITNNAHRKATELKLPLMKVICRSKELQNSLNKALQPVQPAVS